MRLRPAAVMLSILFDPVLSYTYESDISRYTYNDLPDVIDYVVITHNHQDHVLLETMLQLRHRIRHVVVPPGSGALQDPSLRLALQKVGFRSVIELGEMDEIQFEKTPAGTRVVQRPSVSVRPATNSLKCARKWTSAPATGLPSPSVTPTASS